jgi:hypothetical protein
MAKSVNLPPKRKRGRPSKADVAAREAAKLEAARKTNETPEQRIARISERFSVMYMLAEGAVRRTIRSAIISGAAGVGKSFTVERVLNAAKDAGKVDKVTIVRGNLTGFNLFRLMYENSSERDIILIDDADSIYDDEDAMNLLKAGLDTNHERWISWYADNSEIKADKLPKYFKYEGTMLFITNKDFQGIIDHTNNSMVPHMKALMSRSIYLDLMLHTMDDLLAWTTHMVVKHHILVQEGLSRTQEMEAVQWIEQHADRLRELSIRTVKKIGAFMRSHPDKWETLSRVTLLRD